jgi:ABC-2 type transport system permease protein
MTRNALHAEWTKLRTVPGTAWLMAAIVGLTVAVSAGTDAGAGCSGLACPVDTTKLSLTGIQLGEALVAILAVIQVCNEYSSGLIRTTMTAMPRRHDVLVAKAGITCGLVLLAGAIAVLGSLLAGRFILPGKGFDRAHGFALISLGNATTLRAAVGSVLYLGLVALLSVGIAAMVRDSAVTIGVVLGALYLFPVIATFVGNPVWHRRIARYTPMAGLNIQATTGLRTLVISPWSGLGVLAVWAAATLLAGGMLLRLRDA